MKDKEEKPKKVMAIQTEYGEILVEVKDKRKNKRMNLFSYIRSLPGRIRYSLAIRGGGGS